MTVRDFLLEKTNVHELCVVRDSGYIIMTAWIDYEDLFAINSKVGERTVKSDEWGKIKIVTQHNDELEVPCHYIDI